MNWATMLYHRFIGRGRADADDSEAARADRAPSCDRRAGAAGDLRLILASAGRGDLLFNRPDAVPFVLATVIAGRCRRPGGADLPLIAAVLLPTGAASRPSLVIYARGDDTSAPSTRAPYRRDRYVPANYTISNWIS